MVNRYKGKCTFCGQVVKARKGLLLGRRGAYSVAHNSCYEAAPDNEGEATALALSRSNVVVTTFSSGKSVYRNRRGRCEDAPCCGCCS